MRFFPGDIIGCKHSNSSAIPIDARWIVTQPCDFNEPIYCNLIVSAGGCSVIPPEPRVLEGPWQSLAYLVIEGKGRPPNMEDTRDYLSAITGE